MAIALTMLFIVCPLAALFFIVRLACAAFSSKVFDEMRSHPVFHGIWACFALVGVLLFLGVLNRWAWPPPFVERRGQRQLVLDRVQSSGGWAAIQKDCDALAEQHRDSVFFWHRGDTNGLPQTLAALQPWSVQFHSPAALHNFKDFKDEPQVAVVRIKVFGLHSTGGHSTPYFGLEVVSGAGADTYKPKPSRGGASGNRYRSYRPLADRIYEIY